MTGIWGPYKCLQEIYARNLKCCISKVISLNTFFISIPLPGYVVYRMITLPGRKEWERKEKKRLKEEKKMKKK